MTTYPSPLPNYYGILGLDSDASPAEIQQAFWALTTHYHPYLHALNAQVAREAKMMMAEVNEAYAVLSDSILRWRYDQMRLEAFSHASQFNSKLRLCAATFAPEDDAWQSGLRFSAFPGRSLLTLVQQRFLAQPSGGNPKSTGNPKKQMMGALSKAALFPTPFCAATMASAFFWHLAQTTGHAWLAGLTAVLAYPLLLIPLLLRLMLPIRYCPLLSLKQKLVGTLVLVFTAMLLSWLWVAVIDHNGTTPSPFDLYWWCALISVVSICLAYF